MNNEKPKKLIIPLCIVLILVIIIIISFFMNKLHALIYDTTIQNVSELAEHDIINIEAYLNIKWAEIDYMGDRLRSYNCADIFELQEKLNSERSASGFEMVSVLDDKGNLYMDNFMCASAEKGSVEKKQYESGKDKFVVRYDEKSTAAERRRELLLYGIKTEPFTVGDVTIVGIFARMQLHSVENTLRIESFGGQGYSIVFDREGNMVVNINLSGSLGVRENFYTQLKNSVIDDGLTIDEIKQRNKNGEAYTMRYTDAEGVYKILYLAPIEKTEWTFVIVVPYSVFTQQSSALSQMVTVMLVFVGILFICIVLGIYKLLINTMRLKADSQARTDFLSNMSHEIRTPLNGIIGINQLINIHIDDKEKIREYIDKSNSTTQYLLSLVNDILDITKLQANKFDMVSEPFYINRMIDSLCAMQKENFNNRRISFVIQNNINVPCIVGDELRIKQVLMNILSNAAKFTPEGGNVTMYIGQEPANEGFVKNTIRITDTGCGMSKDFQQKIFDSFTQERSKISDSVKGTGLGMSISYLIMKQMGGSISVESEPGKGSTFTVIFDSQIADKVVKPNIAVKRRNFDKQYNILLAEDNELNAEILTEMLRDNDFYVTVAKNGAQALDIFEKSGLYEYDVILMDVQMPVMNGYDACRAIRKLSRPDASDVVIFACTANAFKEDEYKAYESGMNGFIAKPVNIDMLMEKLKGE